MKILFLSIGVGNLLGQMGSTEGVNELDIIKEMVAKDKYVYRMAKYRLKGTVYESPFVAEALIDQYQPDYILLVGTVKSAWSSFYARYGAGEDKAEKILELYKHEKTYGINDSKTRQNLLKLETFIRDIFPESIVHNGKMIALDIQLLSYGTDEQELSLNYKELSDKWEEIVGNTSDEHIDVAFDITHSFRSMPIYNMTILNYLTNISDKAIELSHVYYGNLDVSSENNGIAEIVDLGEITKVNELTNGAAEFNNSGNISSIIETVKNDDPEFARSLEKFDWAVQANRLVLLAQSIGELRKKLAEKKEYKYASLYRMIEKTLNRDFPSEKDFDDLMSPRDHMTAFGKIQRMIGEWHFRHGRYGQAIVCADESFHSYLIPFYLKTIRQSVTLQACTKFKIRQNAFSKFATRKAAIYERARDVYPELNDCILSIASGREEIVDDRNVFAHIVWDIGESSEEKDFDYTSVIDETRKVYQKLSRFEELLASDCERAEDYFYKLVNGTNRKNKDGKKAKPVDTSTHFFTAKTLTKKKTWVKGHLENGKEAMMSVTLGTLPEDIPERTKVIIYGNGPQNHVCVKKIE